MNNYTINVTDTAGTPINIFQLVFLDASGNVIKYDGREVIGEITTGTFTASSDQPQLKYKVRAAGFAEKTITAVPGANTVKLEKAGTIAGAVSEAGISLKTVAIAILVIALIVWAWKKYKAGKK